MAALVLFTTSRNGFPVLLSAYVWYSWDDPDEFGSSFIEGEMLKKGRGEKEPAGIGEGVVGVRAPLLVPS